LSLPFRFFKLSPNEPPLCGVFERACSRRKSSKAGDGRQSSEATGVHHPRSGGSMGKRSEADFAHRPAALRWLEIRNLSVFGFAEL